MSDIHLPLWNDEETDVLPQFQLSYGHALCDADFTEASVKTLAKKLGLPALYYAGELDYSRLPMDENATCRTLGTMHNTHLLIAKSHNYRVIFAPHMLFFNNRAWMNWNKRARGLMAIVVRYDLSDTSYRVFEAGQRRLSAWAKGKALQFPEDPDIEVYLHSELIYRSSNPKVRVTQDVLSMLRSDLEISDTGTAISIKAGFSDEVVPIGRVAHFVFRK